MNHKRGKPKSRRAGCLFCKPHKHQRAPKTARSRAAAAVLAEDMPSVIGSYGVDEPKDFLRHDWDVDLDDDDELDWAWWPLQVGDFTGMQSTDFACDYGVEEQ